ncbi:trypsin-like peptidase domain-containing protein [Candidatus Sumerlaeota bacterium]|nr:trypsin-like peptidase domain-containing protein [Candidatus Sumerlaeota bacterium]
MRRKFNPNSYFLALFATIAAGLMAGLWIGAEETTGYEPLTQNTFIDVAKTVRPAVVSIKVQPGRTALEQQEAKPLDEIDPQELLQENSPFFRYHNFPNRQFSVPDMDPEMLLPRQAGSGVVIRADGYIITNTHVIGQAQDGGDITVELNDGRSFGGDAVEIVGMDPLTDVAVLKIDAKDLPYVEWGDSEELQPGQWVLAIGDPMELRNSVTQGIVSAIGRDLGNSLVSDYIQTTAIINPGNSGGALVDLHKRLVGINVLIVSNNHRWQGVAFTIPSNTARDVAEALIKHGKVRRGFVGVTMADLSRQLKTQLGYDGDGVVAREILPEGPAAVAGIQPGDVIAEINGTAIEDPAALLRVVASLPVDEKAQMKVFRDGEFQTLDVAIAERPEDEMAWTKARKAQMTPKIEPEPKILDTPLPIGEKARLGVRVEPVTDSMLPDADNEALKIVEVLPGSKAEQIDLNVGDVIYEINGQRVRTLQDVTDALDANPNGLSIKCHNEAQRGAKSLLQQWR